MGNRYFITGATGAIGCSLVPLLLEDEATAVDLLIRADNQDQLFKRLNDLFTFWEFTPDDERKKRIHAVIGDIRQPIFGMKQTQYDKISDECTHIVHCAGNVRMNLSIEEARTFSVTSAELITALGQLCMANNNLKKIEFVSTVGIGGRMEGVLSEEWVTKQRDFHNTYEQAKAEAETYISKQIQNGLPITVHRPSMVVGDSIAGRIIHFKVFYHICEFLSGRRTFGITPLTGSTKLDIVPVDYVAKVIAWSSRTQSTIGKVLHECSSGKNAIPISELRQMVRKIFKFYDLHLPLSFCIPVCSIATCC